MTPKCMFVGISTWLSAILPNILASLRLRMLGCHEDLWTELPELPLPEVGSPLRSTPGMHW